ncbi:hypothetical protein MWU60_12450 [Yoonia sp. F2084L]|uniref:hypothetical protein n=1 Tax=Yoonia sp. F2084L TaxID=2926419 RepID=UPI001FF3D738|nr:hypothetical protein [Yoonia sp. F2084L]MCK0096386.1 hypothetical protein [Yoonia sp. F2084L]
MINGDGGSVLVEEAGTIITAGDDDGVLSSGDGNQMTNDGTISATDRLVSIGVDA